MSKRIWLCVIVVAVLFGFYLNRWMEVRGLPEIKSSIDKQLKETISILPGSNRLEIIRRRQIIMEDMGTGLKGQMQYDALLGGTSIDLYVSWTKISTNCQITKIESHSMYSNPQILWERQ